jgi:hypothetical protein
MAFTARLKPCPSWRVSLATSKAVLGFSTVRRTKERSTFSKLIPFTSLWPLSAPGSISQDRMMNQSRVLNELCKSKTANRIRENESQESFCPSQMQLSSQPGKVRNEGKLTRGSKERGESKSANPICGDETVKPLPNSNRGGHLKR